MLQLRKKNEKFRLDCDRLVQLFPQHIKQVRYIQECDFEEAKKLNDDLRLFCNRMRSRPMRHCSFREAFRPMIQESYILRYEKRRVGAAGEAGASSDIMYMLDCNNCYPAQALKELAVGSYESFMLGEEDQRHVSFLDGDMYFHGKKICGVALARVWAPTDLEFPFHHITIKKPGAAGKNLG